MTGSSPDRTNLPARRSADLPSALGLALTHDFCPWANRYVYWIKQPLVIPGLAALVAAFIGLTVTPQGYVVCGGLVAIMLLGIVWPCVGTLGLKASLRFDCRRAREGEEVQAILTVVNRMPWPAWGLMVEGGFDALGDADVAVALARVPGFARSKFEWPFQPPLRGEYPLAPPRLATAFPFGLWKGTRPVTVQSRLLVWPRLIPLDAMPLAQGESWTLGALSQLRCGHEGDVMGTRPFRPGDTLRGIHWPQTARQGQLIVCERQANLTSSVRVLIDGDPAHHCGTGSGSALE